MGGGHKLNGVIFSVIPGLINKESRGSTMQHLPARIREKQAKNERFGDKYSVFMC